MGDAKHLVRLRQRCASLAADRVAISPPTLASISSKTSSGIASWIASADLIASITREISPLEATARNGLSGSPGLGEKSSSKRIRSAQICGALGGSSASNSDCRKPEIGAGCCRTFLASFGAAFARTLAQGCGVRFEAGPRFRDFFAESLQLRVASFDLAHSLRRALAERDHFRNRAAIFALQGFEAMSRVARAARAAPDRDRAFPHNDRGCARFPSARPPRRRALRKLPPGGIDLFQLAQEPLRFGELIERPQSSASESWRETDARQLDQAPAVAGQFVATNDFSLPRQRSKICRGDLVAPDGGADRAPVRERFPRVLERRVPPRPTSANGESDCLILLAASLSACAKRIEQGQLSFRREKRLVIVRAVEIDQLVADGL